MCVRASRRSDEGETKDVHFLQILRSPNKPAEAIVNNTLINFGYASVQANHLTAGRGGERFGSATYLLQNETSDSVDIKQVEV